MKRIIVLGILIIICFVLQTSLLPFIEIANINPNLLLILTVSFGLMRGRMEGMFVGFFCGFLYDIYFGFIIGPYMLIYMLIGYCNGFFHRLYQVDDILLPVIIMIFDDFLFNFSTYLIFFLMRNVIPDMFYTAILTVVVFKFFVFVNKTLKKFEKGME